MSDDPSPPELAPSVLAAWGLREPPARGPRPTLSVTRIAEAAVAVADAEGVAAVSMGRIAAELQVSPMSLYRYVKAKGELLALMVDAAVGAPPTDDASTGWRPALSAWAWAYHDSLRRRPWVLQVPMTGPPVTPNQTAWLERGLRGLAATPLTEPQKLSVMLLLSGFIRNEATLTAEMGAEAGGDIMPGWAAALRRLTTPEGFPALHAALASEAFAQDDDPDDEFIFGLRRLLDGVEALVEGNDEAAG